MSSPRARRAIRSRIAAAAFAAALGACAALAPLGARDELADAERAFARDGLERGIRASFVAHFAPDGLVFEPAPVRVREAWPQRPAPADPLAARLEWRPELVYVARAGDLGVSTGPFHLVNGSFESHGAFFSVWQRQSDGTWKVWLDMGSRSSAPIEAAAWQAPPRPRDGEGEDSQPTASAVTELDRALSGLDGGQIRRRLALDARRYRDGSLLIGPAWEAALAGTREVADYVPSEARVSASGDLAASYGQVTRRAPDGAQARGYYVHVWVRDRAAWWLAVESLVDER